MKKIYTSPETMTMEVATQNHLAFGTVVITEENNEDAAVKEYSIWELNGKRNSLWEEDNEE